MFAKRLHNAVIATILALPLVPFANQNALVNLEITRLYESSTVSRYWCLNILYSDIVNGVYSMVKFSNNNNQCIYNIKAIYRDGSYDIGHTNLLAIIEINPPMMSYQILLHRYYFLFSLNLDSLHLCGFLFFRYYRKRYQSHL